MRLKKKIIINMFILMLLSVAVVLIIEFIKPDVIYKMQHKDFYFNLAMSIFSSSFLLILVTIIEYLNEKKQILEAFYLKALEFYNAYSAIKPVRVGSEDYSEEDICNIIKQYLAISDMPIVDLGNTYAQIDFFLDKKMQMKVFGIYEFCNKLRRELEDLSIHFRLYLNSEGNRNVITQHYIPIANRLFYRGLIKFTPEYQWLGYENYVCNELDLQLEMLLSYLNGKSLEKGSVDRIRNIRVWRTL